ncbi:MAG: 3-hydroxyacyl-ACP dehydratase [Bacteroidota bacterium]
MINYEILDLIPQRTPIVMVDKLVDATDNYALSTFIVEKSNIFFSEGKLQEPGIIENIAQTAAALTGYAAKTNNQPVKLGFIGAVKNLKIHKLPSENSILHTTITVENVVLNINIVNGLIKVDGETIAECEMRIFIEE